MSTTTFQQTITLNYTGSISKPSLFSILINWSKNQQENRLLWLGIALTAHGCILTPLTIFAVVSAGNSLMLFMMALVAMAIALVTNLAALPTKITIPALLISLFIDMVIIITCAVNGFNIASIF
ncbi:MAG: hypothetical protein ACXWCZ_00590 [Flavisolibacter sp.]